MDECERPKVEGEGAGQWPEFDMNKYVAIFAFGIGFTISTGAVIAVPAYFSGQPEAALGAILISGALGVVASTFVALAEKFGF